MSTRKIIVYSQPDSLPCEAVKRFLKHRKAEFEERTGGGIGGKSWVGPLLAKKFRAPIHYRWPEYAATPRGEEWWLPQGA